VSRIMELPVLDMQGVTVDSLAVSDHLLGVPMNEPVVHQAMLRQRANARQGTHSVKTRANVSGGGAKPWRQKGTGRARQGSIRAPHWRGGGIVFGPQTRSYRQRMPKKMRRLAIRCLLSDKFREERLAVLQELQFPEAKTKEMKQLLSTLNVSSSTLIVTREAEHSVVNSARNLPRVKTLPASNLNVLDLLNHDRLIMTVAAIRRAEELWTQEVALPEAEAPKRAAAPKAKRPAGSAATAETAPAEVEAAPPKRKRTVNPEAAAEAPKRVAALKAKRPAGSTAKKAAAKKPSTKGKPAGEKAGE